MAKNGKFKLIPLYLHFDGRISRSTLILFFLLPLNAVSWTGYLLEFLIKPSPSGVIQGIFFGTFIWFNLAGDWKRLHDRNHSGWFILVGLIPLVGPIWLFIELYILKGTVGPNRYGPQSNYLPPVQNTKFYVAGWLATSVVLYACNLLSYFWLYHLEHPSIYNYNMISTDCPDADLEHVDEQVTKFIERELLAHKQEYQHLLSVSQEGKSLVCVFPHESENNSAQAPISDVVQKTLLEADSILPSFADPICLSEESGHQNPLALLILSAPEYSLFAIQAMAVQIRKQLLLADTRRSVEIWGKQLPCINFTVSQSRLRAFGMEEHSLLQALEPMNFLGKRIRVLPREEFEDLRLQMVISQDDYTPLEDFRQLHITSLQGVPIFLKDLAAIDIGLLAPELLVRFDDRQVVAVAIQPNPDLNSAEVVNLIETQVQEIKNEIPTGIEITILYLRTSNTLLNLMSTN